MSRFYITPDSIVDKNTIVVSDKELHHIKDVMRLKAGDSVVAFDGQGKEFTGTIEEVTSRSLKIKIRSTKQITTQKLPEVTLVQAIPKLDRMDYVIQKTTELGISSIIAVETARTIVHLDAAKLKHRMDRWNRIAVEASKQCGRSTIPKIEAALNFKDALKKIDHCDLKLIACLHKDVKKLYQACHCEALHTSDVCNLHTSDVCKAEAISILIGPEGDFTEDEVKMAIDAGCVPVSLGPNVLRTDTAPVAALSILMYEFSKQ